MKIENGTLSVNGKTVALADISIDGLVRVWLVPSEYRANGLFVAVILPGQPDEVPACSFDAAEYLGEIKYEASTSHRLAAAKVAKLEQINSACDLALAALTSTYPPGELQSWPQQVQEAAAFLLDPPGPALLLSAIAEVRGLTVADLAGRVQAKAEGYAAYSGAIIGKRQAAEDLLDQAETLEEVSAIAW